METFLLWNCDLRSATESTITSTVEPKALEGAGGSSGQPVGDMRRPARRQSPHGLVTLGLGFIWGFGLAFMILSSMNTSSETGDELSAGEEVDESGEQSGRPEAQRLEQEVRILCWIMTNPRNHDRKAIHVKNTWGKRCNKLLFMSSQVDPKLGTIALENVEEGRDFLWAKTKEAFKYVYKHHFNEADWFMKADDDTYVIVENLRFVLKDYDPMFPIYFGCKFKSHVRQGFMSGGAGYVLSKEALRRFVEVGLRDRRKCYSGHDHPEDVEIGRCLERVGVEAGDSRDSLGRYTFLPFVPELHVMPGQINDLFWYGKYLFYNQTQGMECCSDFAVSFHYVSAPLFYAMEYLIYSFKLVPSIPSPVHMTETESQEDPPKPSDWLLPDQ